MNTAAIISGLLIWRGLPPLFEKSMTEKNHRIFQIACMVAGLGTIAGGIIYGLFH